MQLLTFITVHVSNIQYVYELNVIDKWWRQFHLTIQEPTVKRNKNNYTNWVCRNVLIRLNIFDINVKIEIFWSVFGPKIFLRTETKIRTNVWGIDTRSKIGWIFIEPFLSYCVYGGQGTERDDISPFGTSSKGLKTHCYTTDLIKIHVACIS